MCLSQVTSVEKELFGEDEYQEGYKIILDCGEYWRPALFSHRGYMYDIWNKDVFDEGLLHADVDCYQYPTGFHIITTQDIKDCTVYIQYLCLYSKNISTVKVKYRKVVAKGIQYTYYNKSLQCVVAQEIFIEKPTNENSQNNVWFGGIFCDENLLESGQKIKMLKTQQYLLDHSLEQLQTNYGIRVTYNPTFSEKYCPYPLVILNYSFGKILFVKKK